MIDEELERWRKMMSPEEFKSKFPEYAMKRAINETIDKLEKQNKMKDEKIDPVVSEKITNYVYNNYKQYKDKKLFINETSNCFTITDNKDKSPLILGKTLFV